MPNAMLNRVDITAHRKALTDAVAHLPGTAHVTLGPSTYGRTAELVFVVTVTVGPVSEETEEVVDRLFNDLPEAIETVTGVGTLISKTSGHRLYSTGPDTPPQLGCEWTVKMLP